MSTLTDDVDMKCYNKKFAYFTCDKDDDCTWCKYLGTLKDQHDNCSSKKSAIHYLDTSLWNCPGVNMTNEFRHCVDYINDREGCKADPLCDGCTSKQFGPADFICDSAYDVKA